MKLSTGARREPRCAKCGGEVVAGTLFCWRHAASPPRVGEVSADHGQLLWRTTGEATALGERALAVLLDGEPAFVRHVEELLGARPVRLLVELQAIGEAGASAVTTATIDLARLLAAVQSGDERIEARRAD